MINQTFSEGLPFDDAAARQYGYITEFVPGAGRSPRGRVPDVMIAATAAADGAALITRDGKDFFGLETLIKIIYF
ncbi:hypothetical protein [Lacisediminihabitans changchengi]|uniref:Type II toxin-antitoxin system VapC family toxin n=1 Tax=Lacisediminihabitans changchengi TaxID=2787634 RepID=A0A934W2B6_9MICO|nr:hypothetical protein [Lacisediminihabitans changchengi]MBK4346666.1 hypothetical protein [Lacisediminihabitans changchengi]